MTQMLTPDDTAPVVAAAIERAAANASPVLPDVRGGRVRWQAMASLMRAHGWWYPDRNPMPRFRLWRWWP